MCTHLMHISIYMYMHVYKHISFMYMSIAFPCFALLRFASPCLGEPHGRLRGTLRSGRLMKHIDLNTQWAQTCLVLCIQK